MSLPACIEIVASVPFGNARVGIPGSKSVTNRALILAALASGETTLRGALWSEDTQVMVECLQELGYMVQVEPDALEPGNRTLTVYGKGPAIPRGGTEAQPVELFVGNAGTAARFLAAMVCLGSGVYQLSGIPRMHERPQSALFQALRGLGYRIDSANDRLPASFHGGGPRPGRARVSVTESSQFASALLLCSRAGGWQIEVSGENADESPYVKMTEGLLETFRTPASLNGEFQVEADASSGSYFIAADWLTRRLGLGRVEVAGWPESDWQIDASFPKFVPPSGEISRARHLADSILTAMVLAPFAEAPVRFTDLGRLRMQECERVVAMRTELQRCGARVEETGDTLTIWPGALHHAEIETYNDHRIAMCFSVLAITVPGMHIRNPSCVKKTFPTFFQKLAAAPPAGLGLHILDSATKAQLTDNNLFAA